MNKKKYYVVVTKDWVDELVGTVVHEWQKTGHTEAEECVVAMLDKVGVWVDRAAGR